MFHYVNHACFDQNNLKILASSMYLIHLSMPDVNGTAQR